MCLHRSANWECNLSHAWNCEHMHQVWIIVHWEEEYVYTHICMAYLRFLNIQLFRRYWVVLMAVRVQEASVVPLPVSCLWQSGGGVSVQLWLQLVSEFIVVQWWEGRRLSVRCRWTIARCLANAAFTILCPRNYTPHSHCSQTLVCGSLIRYCVSSIAVFGNPHWFILPIFK
jgi:hypothetical protein